MKMDTTKREYNDIQKRLLKVVISNNKFSKMQKRLLHALSSFYGVSEQQLSHETKSTSIRSLIRDTNIHLRSIGYKRPVQIVSLYKEDRRKGFYKLDLNIPPSTEK